MTEGLFPSYTDFSYRDNMPKTEFTKAHLEVFKTLTDRWKRDAYSTRRIDKPFARAAINALYRLEGRPAPFIVWTKSPLANIFAKVLCDEILGLTTPDRVFKSIRTSDQILWNNIGRSVINSLVGVTTDFTVVNKDGLEELIKDGKLWRAFGQRDDQGVDGSKSIIENSLHYAIRKSPDFINRSPDSSLAGETIWRDICEAITCLLYTSPSPRDRQKSRMPSSA